MIERERDLKVNNKPLNFNNFMIKEFNFFSTNLAGNDLSPYLRLFSRCAIGIHLKFSFSLKPPYVVSEPVKYAKFSSLITSIIGHGTVCLLV